MAHVPSDPVKLHAWQVVEHVPVQQTHCEQYCLPSGAAWHSLALLHLAPSGLGPHDPFTQEFGATHWLFCVQLE